MAASGLITDYLQRGPAADRPTTPNVYEGSVALYLAEDTGALSAWSGSGWVVVSTGAAGVPDAPLDGVLYGRRNGAWVSALTSPENAQTGTAYTLVLADAFKLVAMNNAAANTLTVPPNSDVAFPLGTRIDLSQDGAGQTTIAAGSGVTIRTPETLKLRKQWGKATLIKRATNTWDLEGNLEAAP